MMKNWMLVACVGAAVLSAGCGEETVTTNTPPAANTAATPAATPTHAPGHHNRIPIGEASQSGLKLVATQDAPIEPGGDAAFDVVITGGKPKAVRFWVGSEDAKGSVKARAEEETTDNWHTHAEVPDPMPADSKFWVEVEPPTGETFRASFDLKVQ